MDNQREERPQELVYVQLVREDLCSAGDEISLIDLWLVLARRKWMIIGITILCLALGAGYAWMKPVTYEYRTGIRLAAIHGGKKSDGWKLLTSGERTMALLNELIIPQQRQKLFGAAEDKGPKIDVVRQKKDRSLTLKSNAQQKNAGQVKQLHQAVAEELARRQAEVLEKRIEMTTKPYVLQTSLLQDQLKTLQKQLQLLGTHLDEGTSVRSLVNALQMGDIRKEITDTRMQLVRATSAIELIREASHPTRIPYSVAVKSDQPVGMGKPIIIALSLVLGLMMGVWGAFFSEFLATAKSVARERKQRGSDLP